MTRIEAKIEDAQLRLRRQQLMVQECEKRLERERLQVEIIIHQIEMLSAVRTPPRSVPT